MTSAASFGTPFRPLTMNWLQSRTVVQIFPVLTGHWQFAALRTIIPGQPAIAAVLKKPRFCVPESRVILDVNRLTCHVYAGFRKLIRPELRLTGIEPHPHDAELKPVFSAVTATVAAVQ
jgi:hypothetical protein